MGPCCMGEGAGGAKGDGPCSAASEVIVHLLSGPLKDNMYYYVLFRCKLHYK